MSTTMYFEDELHPVSEDGKSDKTKPSNTFEIYVSNYFGDDQIYLKIIDENGNEKQFHISKEQATQLSEGAGNAVSYIGYDNK